MKKIYKIGEIPKEEQIYLSKDFFGWKVVHPIKNEDGSYNWFNILIGSWWNLIGVLFILFLLAMFFLAYREASIQLTECLARESSETVLNFINFTTP